MINDTDQTPMLPPTPHPPSPPSAAQAKFSSSPPRTTARSSAHAPEAYYAPPSSVPVPDPPLPPLPPVRKPVPVPWHNEQPGLEIVPTTQKEVYRSAGYMNAQFKLASEQNPELERAPLDDHYKMLAGELPKDGEKRWWRRNKKLAWGLVVLLFLIIVGVGVGAYMGLKKPAVATTSQNNTNLGLDSSSPTNTTRTSKKTPSSTLVPKSDYPGLAAVWDTNKNKTTIFYRPRVGGIYRSDCTLSANTGGKNKCTTSLISSIKDYAPDTPLSAIGTPDSAVLLFFPSSSNTSVSAATLSGSASVTQLDSMAITKRHASSHLAALGTPSLFSAVYQTLDTVLRSISTNTSIPEVRITDTGASPGTRLGPAVYPYESEEYNSTTRYSIFFFTPDRSANGAHTFVERWHTDEDDPTTYRDGPDLPQLSSLVVRTDTSFGCAGWQVRGGDRRNPQDVTCYFGSGSDGRVLQMVADVAAGWVGPYPVPGDGELATNKSPLVAKSWYDSDSQEPYGPMRQHVFFPGPQTNKTGVLVERVYRSDTSWIDGSGLDLKLPEGVF